MSVKQVPILMYHWFRREGAPSASRSPQLEITPELFERQMKFLSARGFRSVTLTEAFGPDGRRKLPPKPIAITFDDGTLDFWEFGRPLLERHDMTATLFVVTDRVGGESSWDADLGEPARPLMDWEQIEELAEAGFEIGSHTASHRPFTELDDEAIRSELTRSRETLFQKLGAAPSFLAYPRGFYRPEHKRLVREAGYWGACAVAFGWRDLGRSDDYELKRMTIKGDESMLRFAGRVLLARRVPYRGRESLGPDPAR